MTILRIDWTQEYPASLNDVPLKLGLTPLRLLTILAEHPRQVIAYGRIYARLWPDVIVEMQQISYHLHFLRRHLPPDTIRTVPHRGLVLTIPADQIELQQEMRYDAA